MEKKPEKKKELDQLREKLADNGALLLTGYEKLTVQQDFELRNAVREAGGSYKVIKNRIAEKASEGSAAGGLLKELKGMCSIAFTSGDPVALAKALAAYAKANPAFTFKAGLGQSRVVGITRTQPPAPIPPQEQIYPQLFYLINA